MHRHTHICVCVCVCVYVRQVSLVKNLPAMQETQVQTLSGEDPLEKEMATPIPVFFPGKSHEQRSLTGYSPWGHQESNTTYRLNCHHLYLNITISLYKVSHLHPCFEVMVWLLSRVQFL